MQVNRGKAGRVRHWATWLLVGTGFMLIAGPSVVQAAGLETRDFSILIDGKKAGECRLAIRRQDDGHLVLSGQADVRVSYLVYTYTYSFRGSEVWKDGRLLRLMSNANDDGKKLTLTVQADGDALHVTANGQTRKSRPDVWTTTYWRLAEAKFRNRQVPLLDADTGKEITATLQFVGTSQINVAGQAQNCAHYRVTGGVQADLWYDAQEYLVRQESVEDGHKTVLEVTRVRR